MVDPSNTTLGKMILDEISPAVMVLRTPLVEESCRKNNLSFIQMLSPFCNFTNIDVPVRTASDQPYRLQKFKLRLFYPSEIQQPNVEIAKERLKQVITEAGEKYLPQMFLDSPPIEDIINSSISELIPSWFHFFNKELIRTVSFSDHEAFDHPVACLLVVSTKDEQFINKFIDLFNTNQLPSLLNDGSMDPRILKHYVLVHDSQDGPLENASTMFTEMKNTFGSNDCRLLCINSSPDKLAEYQDNPWASLKINASHSADSGVFLNIDDINEIKDFLQDLSSKYVIPYMEQKLRVLNQQVSATRKGFRNQIKNLWWRKGKEETVDTPNGPVYTYSSTESQIRVLGDYAFMLRDYELAMSNYRLISTDYKLDKSWKRYAGVQEMLGLTYYMLDQSRKEAEYCMENAFNTYLKMGPSGQQNATRCGLWWAEMLKARNQFKEAASVYFRISGEEPLHSAVMLEQASYCYLFPKPPMLYKYGFHLVLSGERYRKCDQIKHAIRTYRGAISVYRGTRWGHIKDHVHFHIGKWYAFLGSFDVAATHLLEVLACSHQSKTTQETFFRDLLQIVQETGRTFEVLKLQLPVINISTLKVLFDDHRTCASPTAVSVKESLWSSLEEDMIPSVSTTRSNWLESQPTLKKYKESNLCVAGESVKVDIELKNPLQIAISISNISLICEHSTRIDETESDSAGAQVQDDSKSEMLNITREQRSSISFSLSEVDLSLEGGETSVVQLTVTPKVEGILKIIGVQWKLSSSLVGFHKFESNIVQKKVKKGRRKSKPSPGDYLRFLVIKNVPKLDGFIHSLPSKVYAGDIQRLVLELKNTSEYSVKNLKMKISHPRFITVGNKECLAMEFPACFGRKNNSDSSCIQANHDIISHAMFSFPEDTSIKGESPFLWPLWLRGAVPGNISLYISIYYEMEDVSSIMKYRTLRMHYNLQVLPSMDVSFQISPCASRLEEFLVRMDVANRTTSESFQIHQLSCIGCQWEISLLQPVDKLLNSQLVIAGQALSYFFKLKSGSKISNSEDNYSSLYPFRTNDVRLCAQGGDEALYDISTPPLTDFHRSERLHQGLSHKGHPGSVDFILISQTKKSGNGTTLPDDLPHLFSHHACHCSVVSTSPVWWSMDGPRTIHHNFSVSFREIKLKMTIRNSSNVKASIQMRTVDSNDRTNQSSDSSTLQSANDGGWHDVPLVNDAEVKSDALGTARVRKSVSSPETQSISPFIWSGTSNTNIEMERLSEAEISLQVCVFSPGTYDLSNYNLIWNLLPSDEEGASGGSRQTSGTCSGYPYYLTVLQSE